ncbi:hypothetical protein IQ250_09875 [Pseudanabaenaceae cyanobacterium LEGE 13415]|nr:hypothetical protein [Pseudanabaenaceae cyanobacterium LEGE 13415]
MKVNLAIRILILFAGVGIVAASIPLHPEVANSQSANSALWGNFLLKATLKATK